MIAAAIYTGMRKGRLFGLRWIDVLFDRGLIHVAYSSARLRSPASGAPCRHPALRRSCSTGTSVLPGVCLPVVPDRGQQAWAPPTT